MKLEQGDKFEQRNAAWLRENLPCYEKVWAAFIGHNGCGWPCEMQGLDQDKEADRKRFYQAHYSFALQVPKIARFANELDQSLGAANDYESLDQTHDQLFFFMSRLGHVRDMFKLMEEALKCTTSLSKPLQDFYAKRSHMIHGPRLPIRMNDGMVMIPKIGGDKKLFTEWGNRATWDSFSSGDFIYLRDFVSDLAEEFLQLVNKQHGKVFDSADRRFDGRRIVPPEKQVPPLRAKSGNVSSPAISSCEVGESPPSGTFQG